MKLQKRMMKSVNIYIIGAGGHGQVVADTIIKMGFFPKGFLDDNKDLLGKKILGIPVVGNVSDAKNLSGKFVVAIGDNFMRKTIVDKLEFSDDMYFTVIHPSSVIGDDVKIGVGSMIIGGTVINTGTTIGKHTIVNTSASIDHHNKIHDFVHIAPGSHTGGNVEIGYGSFLGVGVSVIPGVRVAEWSVIGAGSVVISNIPSHSVAVGVPCKVIKHNGGKK